MTLLDSYMNKNLSMGRTLCYGKIIVITIELDYNMVGLLSFF